MKALLLCSVCGPRVRKHSDHHSKVLKIITHKAKKQCMMYGNCPAMRTCTFFKLQSSYSSPSTTVCLRLSKFSCPHHVRACVRHCMRNDGPRISFHSLPAQLDSPLVRREESKKLMTLLKFAATAHVALFFDHDSHLLLARHQDLNRGWSRSCSQRQQNGGAKIKSALHQPGYVVQLVVCLSFLLYVSPTDLW